ncbi:Replicative DNA helicase [subsurface metagenome]
MTEKDFDTLPEQDIEIEGKPRPAGEYLEEYYQTLGDGETKFLGIETDFDRLNKATLGLDGLIVLGGLAGQGKTSFALQLAFEVSDLGTPAIFYSLEMPRRAIFTKILNRVAKVRYSDILLKGRRYLTGEQIEKELLSFINKSGLSAGKDILKTVGDIFYIRTRERGEADISFETVEQEINFIKAEHKDKKLLVVIDHLQVFDVPTYRDQVDRESKLITGFKGISERTGATILLVSQKNKAGYLHSGLQTIKGSVDIVYLADVVMFLEGEKEKKNQTIEDFEANEPRTIYLKIDKNRYNAPTKIKMEFNGEYSEFTEAL